MSLPENEIQNGLLNFYEKKFPNNENINILSLDRISDGWENDVYSFTMEYKVGSVQKREELILRVYPGDDAVQKSTKEYNTMKRLHKIGFPVPEVLLLESDSSFLEKPFVVMEKINGRSMGDFIDESPQKKQQELLTLFCKMFVDLHKLDWKPFAPDLPMQVTENSDLFVNNRLSQAHELFHSFQQYEFDPVFDWLKVRIPNIGWDRLSLIHLDYHPWNILIKDDGKAFVIDWTCVEVSDFRFDLGWTLLLASTHGYPEMRNIILNEYERIAGFSIKHINFFEVVACIRRLFSVLVSFSHGAEKMGMRPGAETMMRQHSRALKGVYAILVDRTGITIPEVEKLL